jgi:hypothetical protein
MVGTEGSGITGIILTVLLYFATFIISSLLVYEYLVYVHKDARILDLWRRVKGSAEEFFMPGIYECIYADLCMYICMYVFICVHTWYMCLNV